MYLTPASAPRTSAQLLELGEPPLSIDRFLAELGRWKRHPRELFHVRERALELVRDAAPNGEREELRRVFEYVRDAVRYVKDVRGVDTLQTPTATLERLQGDCDDKTLLLAALLESIGYPTRFVVAATKPGQSYNHVYLEAYAASEGRWIALEPSIASYPFGRALPSFEPVRHYS